MLGIGQSKDSAPSSKEPSAKEWKLIERVVMANTDELKRSRRWGIFFKILTFVYLFGLLFLFLDASNAGKEGTATGGHTAVIDVQGVIADGKPAGADAVVSSLRAALKNEDTKVVILRINSPGGSPVQSSYIYNEIIRLRDLHPEVPIHSVISDSGASGAYYIAAATENIYANGASIVGSIGVTSAQFGFQELLDKLGVERRQFTSGEHKAFLDPFVELKEEEKALFETLLNDVHQQFIDDVKAGRGDRLKPTEKTFSGLFWTGRQALEMGLVDGLKSTSELARELGYEQVVDYTYRPSPLQSFADSLGVSIAKALLSLSSEQGFSLR
ncbi:signal peptide peptidase SppA [Reinekea marina]|uniref:Signal peptide peptidase SppA n=1 Tax=Reinekea marina TaxID=1310421 RepID=A0ABV7WRC5_9GAMM|nr:signal peptide peptidase SppA [Reinekea marina]MDN3649528.1 signal peptide peptidase SppA [Reinekea marina]